MWLGVEMEGNVVKSDPKWGPFAFNLFQYKSTPNAGGFFRLREGGSADFFLVKKIRAVKTGSKHFSYHGTSEAVHRPRRASMFSKIKIKTLEKKMFLKQDYTR
jgi:hypothetical protein